MALKRDQAKNKVWCFVGDMTMETGVFHECYKYSKNFNLPLEWVIEDNGMSVHTPTEMAWGEKQKIPEDVISCPISNQGFIDDLLSCDLIYQTAGSQLLGEVGVLGLPSLCIPEPGQVEQEINAVLASKAYPNVAMLKKRKITADDLDAALLSTNNDSSSITFDNGVEGAYNVIQDFLDSRITNIAS